MVYWKKHGRGREAHSFAQETEKYTKYRSVQGRQRLQRPFVPPPVSGSCAADISALRAGTGVCAVLSAVSSIADAAVWQDILPGSG